MPHFHATKPLSLQSAVDEALRSSPAASCSFVTNVEEHLQWELVMLGMKKYPKKYVAECRRRVEENVRAYRETAKRVPSRDFETRYFNDQTMLLDYMFVHRLTGIEGKDGNPLNEVRIICNSLLLNGGKLQVDKLPGWPNSAGSGMKLPPDRSVLKLKTGDAVQLTEADFVRLSEAFFAEIERKYL
jgi:hypothetical protein